MSTYEEPPLDYALQPRLRTYKPRMDRSGFADKSVEKAAQREKILEEERRLREKTLHYVHEGRLDFSALKEPVPPEVRSVFLSITQYGQRFFLEKRGEGTCQLVCTDGTLSMPDCVLVFEENGYV